MQNFDSSLVGIRVVRGWRAGGLHLNSILWTNDLRAVALGISTGIAGVVKESDAIGPAIEAVRSGLVVRSFYSHQDLGISVSDHTAIALRARAMDFEAIGLAVGYSSRQVRRRLAAICTRCGLAERELALLGTVMMGS